VKPTISFLGQVTCLIKWSHTENSWLIVNARENKIKELHFKTRYFILLLHVTADVVLSTWNRCLPYVYVWRLWRSFIVLFSTLVQIVENMNIKTDWLIDFGVLNATFSNISAISWRPVLLVEEVGVSGENHRQWTSNW
jgi:hypothetical protein